MYQLLRPFGRIYIADTPLRRHHRSWNETMKAIQYQSFGDYSENRLVDLPQPSLKDGEVLVAMRKTGVNPLDNTFRWVTSTCRRHRTCLASAVRPEWV